MKNSLSTISHLFLSRSMLSGAFFCVITLLTLYSLFGFIAVPYYLGKNIPLFIDREGQLQFDIASITCNPYTLQLNIHGITASEKNKLKKNTAKAPLSQPALTIDSIHTKFALLPLLRAEWVCSAIQINKVNLNIIRKKNKLYNIDSFFSGFKRKKHINSLEFSDLPFYFSFNNIVIKNSNISFTDMSVTEQKRHSINEITLRIPTVANIAKKIPLYTQPYFSAKIDGNPIKITGKEEGNTSSITTTLYNLPLKDYISYLPAKLPFTVERALLDGNISLTFSSNTQNNDGNASMEERIQPYSQSLGIHFDIEIKELAVKGKKELEKATIESSRLQGNYSSIKNQLTIKNARFIRPFVQCEKPYITNPLFIALSQKQIQNGLQDKQSLATDIPVNNPFSLQLDKVTLSEGSFRLINSGSNKKWGIKKDELWQHINLTAHNLFADNRHPEYAQSDNRKSGSFNIKGEVISIPHSASSFTGAHLSEPLHVTLSGLIAPYHRRGIPKLSNGFIILENIEDFSQLSRSFGLPANNNILNSKSNSFTARKLQLGPIGSKPIESGSDTFHLGTLQIDGAKIHLTPKKLPLPLQLALITKPPFILDGLKFNGALTLLLEKNKKLHLSELQIQSNTEDANNTKKQNVHFSAAFNEEYGKENKKIIGKGELTFFPFSLTSQITLNNINLTKDLRSLVEDRDHFFYGVASGEGTLTLPHSNFDGNLQIKDGGITDKRDGKALLQYQKIAIEKLRLSHKSITAHRVRLTRPRWSVLFSRKKTPLLSLVSENCNIIEKSNCRFSIAEIILNNGNLKIEDKRLSPPWNAIVDNINGRIAPFSFTGNTKISDIQLQGQLGTGAIAISGSTNFCTPTNDSRLSLEGKHLPLSLFHSQLDALKFKKESNTNASFALHSLWINGTMNARGDIQFCESSSDKTKANGKIKEYVIDSSFTPNQNIPPIFSLFYKKIVQKK